jgi:malonyl-CoA O-methyltransferase
MRAEENAMLPLLPNLRGKTVIDLACGSGRYGQLAVERGAACVIGVDDSPAMIAAGRRAGVRLRFLEATMMDVPLQSAVADALVCALAVGHVPHVDPVIQEISRLLKPGGIALVSDFHPKLFATGAKRTFTGHDGTTYAVEHYAHPLAHVRAIADSAGLDVIDVWEPRLWVDQSWRPAVVIYRLKRRADGA